jgi:AraC family transcriptional regulator of adaptative response/methylated-DNA-[protein]-cysteine methyltransferase
MGEKRFSERDSHYAAVARAIGFIRANAGRQPSLAETAASVDLSEQHLQRVFSAWAGISAKRFLQFMTKEHAKAALRESKQVLAAALDAGLPGPGRLHDPMVSCEAVTPGEIRAGGQGVVVGYGVAGTPFGSALIAWTPRGVCHLAFRDQDCGRRPRELVEQWPAATLERDDRGASALAKRIFPAAPAPGSLHLILRGTNFQIKVWEALLKIGPSQLISYGQLAALSGYPKAQRAVGSALAANNIAFLIPCHRVIRSDGEVGIYRWGKDRKLAMQAWEESRAEGNLGAPHGG